MILLDIAIIFFLEIIEASITKDKSFEEMIEWYASLIKHKILMFLALQASLFYILYTAYENRLSGFIISFAVVMKIADLVTKVYLSSKVDENGRFSMMKNFNIPTMEISTPLRYSGVLIYPLAILLAAV